MRFIPLRKAHIVEIPWQKPKKSKTLERIHEIWAEESKKRLLYNGFIFCLTSYDEISLTGSYVPYKFLLAQMKDPVIRKEYILYPLGVSGLVVCGNEILIGRRSSFVSQHKGYLECIPSGSFEKGLSPEKRLVLELMEEACIDEQCILSKQLLGLFYSASCKMYDIGYLITVKNKEVSRSSQEYTMVQWMKFSAWKKICRSTQKVVPLSKSLFSFSFAANCSC